MVFIKWWSLFSTLIVLLVNSFIYCLSITDIFFSNSHIEQMKKRFKIEKINFFMGIKQFSVWLNIINSEWIFWICEFTITERKDQTAVIIIATIKLSLAKKKKNYFLCSWSYQIIKYIEYNILQKKRKQIIKIKRKMVLKENVYRASKIELDTFNSC